MKTKAIQSSSSNKQYNGQSWNPYKDKTTERGETSAL